MPERAWSVRRDFQLLRSRSGSPLSGRQEWSKQGLSLIELMIVFLITGVFFGMWGRFLSNFYASHETAKVITELQEQAQYAMDQMIYGCIDDPNASGGAHRKGGLIWASSCTIDSSGKRLSFRDLDSSEIVYEVRDKKLFKHLASSSPQQPKDVIIPYLEGEREHEKAPYEVDVNFAPDKDNPDRVISIEVRVSKDRLSSVLRSTVTLRNRSGSG